MRHLIVFSIMVCLMQATSSCNGKQQKTAEVETTAEKVDSAEEIACDTPTSVSEKAVPERQVSAAVKEANTDDGYPSTYNQPKGTVLELLKDYNAHMADYNTTGVVALGMGSQGNRVLLNFSVTDIYFALSNKVKLKKQARELIESLPIGEKTAWRCIPEEGYELMVTFVGKQSLQIVSVIFTKDELKEMF
jgi:hypothetical protein